MNVNNRGFEIHSNTNLTPALVEAAKIMGVCIKRAAQANTKTPSPQEMKKELETFKQGALKLQNKRNNPSNQLDSHSSRSDFQLSQSSTETSTESTFTINPDNLRDLISEARQKTVGEKYMAEVKGENFLVANNGNNISIYHIANKRLGHGNYGDVFVATDTNTKQKYVLKVARLDKGEDAIKDLNQEVSLLQDIHSKGTIDGIQSAPTDIFTFLMKDGTKRVGYFTKLYNGGVGYGNKHFKTESKGGMSLTNRLDCFRQLTTGLRNMQIKGIKHGDLKPNNTLLNHEENGSWQLVISDFGGCRKYESITANEIRKDQYVGGFDSAYITSKDREYLTGLSQKYPADGGKENDAKLKDEFIKLTEKRDVYGIGRTLWQLVTGDEAGVISGNQLPRYTEEDDTVNDDLKEQLNSFGPALDPLKSLIADMCKIDPNERISSQEAARRMDEIFKRYG